MGVSAAALLGCIARDWINGAVIAAGFCGIGLGYWINMPFQNRLIPGGLIHGRKWHPYFTGFQFIAMGYAAVAVGVYRGL